MTANGSNRLISVLQLFEGNQPVWTVSQIGAELGISTSTAYRHVRDLVKSGFLDPVTGAGYALGPAFIRYDRILRQNDLLIKIADPVMAELIDRTSQSCMIVLCRRFKDCVMCVHEKRGKKSRGQTSYERGVAMPLFLGATSKVILAQLPGRVLKSIYLANEKTIRRLLRTRNWAEFRAPLREIRRAGFAMTESEIVKGRAALAAPITRNGQLVAGISLIVAGSGWTKRRISAFVPALLASAQQISQSLSRETPMISR